MKKISKKYNAKSKSPLRIKKLLMSRKAIAMLLASAFLLGGVILALPRSYEKTESTLQAHSIVYKDENGIELGDEKTAQEGKDGQRYVKYKYTQSFFERLLKRTSFVEEIGSEIVEQPTDKIVLKGTRKWQYMMCSNGTYRYYPSEQFKDRNIGFTSKSPDYCAQNNAGKKLSLADTPTGKNNMTKPSYIPPNCSVREIPYKTVYQDVSWLYTGETQETTGLNGFKYICSDGSMNSVVNPLDRIIYRGTGKKPTAIQPITPSTPTPNYSARQK